MRLAAGSPRVRFVALVLVALLTVLGAGPILTSSHASADGCAEDGSAPYLHTCGGQIVDASGTPVRLRAVNWYGFDSNDFVAGGLGYQTYQAIVDHIKGLGFNALRIPLSNELIERDPVVSALGPICVHLSCLPVTSSTLLGPNSDLYGMDALGILKTIVDYAASQGLYVILDDHRNEAGWGPEANGLWYTATTCPATAASYTCYTPQSWLADWAKIGALFQNDSAVTGMDLRNEPHWVDWSVSGGRWQPSDCADYVRFAHWGPCGGLNNDATDWAQAATQAGDELLAINAHWLMFVEGGSTYPQSDGSFSQDGWGENLQGVATDPIVLSVANRLVYSPHDYRWEQPTTSTSADDMFAGWTRNFGFLAVPGQPYTAPIWVGEFGTCTHANSCIDDSAANNTAGWWFSTFMDYLDNGDPANGVLGGMSWGYWPVNGTYSDSWSYDGGIAQQHWRSCYGQREDYGVLGGDWSTLSAPLLQQMLFLPTATATTTSIASTPTATETITVSPTATMTITPTPLSTATTTATATVTATPAITPTGTAAPSLTALPILSPTATGTALPLSTIVPLTLTAAPTVTGTPVISASPTVPALATATVSPAATATVSPTIPTSPTATITPTLTATAAPTDSPTPAPTATAPPPSQWPSGTCAAYTITATPGPTATARPTATTSPTATARPTATATATPLPHYQKVKTLHSPPKRKVAAKPKAKPKSKPKAKPKVAPPLIAARGTALRKRLWLDVSLRRDTHSHLKGRLHYNDRHKKLWLHVLTLRKATTSCGRTRTATVVARLRDGKHSYNATLHLSLDAHHRVRFTMQLGHTYRLSTTLAGKATITCAPAQKHSTSHPSHQRSRSQQAST